MLNPDLKDYDVSIVFVDGVYQNRVANCSSPQRAYAIALADARAMKVGPTFYGKVLSHTEVLVQ